jgi:hypothetical protein
VSYATSADPVEAVAAESPPVAVSAPAVAASLQILGGDEIIQLSIRPSPWSIAIHSFKLLLATVLGAAAVGIAGQRWPYPTASVLLAVIVLVGFSGVVAASFQWASRLYLLTNRRILCFHGVFNVHVGECGLSQIGEARLQCAWYEPWLRLGSIHMQPADSARPVIVWEHVAHPAQVHEILVRAIQKAKMS